MSGKMRVDTNACHLRWRAAVRVVALAFVLAMVVFARVVVQRRSGQVDHPIDMVIAHATPAAFLVPGMVLLLRRRWHLVGWLLCLLAVSFASSFSSDWSKVSFGGTWLYWYLNTFGDWLGWPVMVSMSRFVLKFGDDPTFTRPWQYRTPVRCCG